MNRTARLNPISPKQRAARAAEGDMYPTSTFRRKPSKDAELACRKALSRTPAPRTRSRYTGPKKSVIELIDKRSGKRCEWPGCHQPATERHHRLNRKSGGRHGEAHERVNGPAWLLSVCHTHHMALPRRRKIAERMGWLLREHQDATQVPVQTRHDAEPVWLDNSGRWHRYEEGAA
jgi:hypothetical protein